VGEIGDRGKQAAQRILAGLLSLCLCVLLLTAGCQRAPVVYPPPAQRPSFQGVEPPPVMGRFVKMSDANIDEYLVKDVSRSTEGGTWRWTFRRPELRFFLETTEHLRFSMDFSLTESTFRETGPVSLAVTINDKPFAKIHVSKPDQLHWEKPVPPALLKPGVNFVAIQPDKVFIAKADGAALGFVLTSAGFVR
jgi:hypothetical protein